MWTTFVVTANPVFEHASQMTLAQRNQKVQTLGSPDANFTEHPHPTIELPYPAIEIASILKRKEKSVNRSLKRLGRSGKVQPFENVIPSNSPTLSNALLAQISFLKSEQVAV